mmetsp:Transcript_13372/g.24578  ORF Transcript_13372/g.24578 Transcript_13372/m.24578 type:complete len:425 (+) Transcript_13372:102-1376(+)
MVVTMNNSRSSNEGLLYSIILFACSAKLWTTLNDKKQLRRRRSSKNNDGDWSPSSSPPIKSNDNVNDGGVREEEIKSWNGSRNSVAKKDENDNKLSQPVDMRNRSMSEEQRLLLMERISKSDSVLTRETSLDFHPKNGNWSHFENYAPPFTPPKNSTAAENEQEEFLWSEPPLNCNKETNDPIMDTSQNKKYTRQSSTNCQEILSLNAKYLPSKLIMIRHGQSEDNVNELLYATKPDNAMRLTKLGWEMARMAGKALKDQLPPNQTVHFIVSPYARTVETFHGIVSAWSDPEEFAHMDNRSKRLKLWYTKLMEMGLTWHEDPRIREQDFGNYQDPQVIKKAKSERHKFGSFYYRFPHGESASDVFDRVSTFLDSLWRSFESGRAQNYVLVAHGISIRVFLSRYFRYSIDQFHMLANPRVREYMS